MKKVFNYECYFCNPTTGEEGWDIKFISVVAETREGAREMLKTVPHFDCVILYNREFTPDAIDEMMIGEGLTHWETDGDYNVLISE